MTEGSGEREEVELNDLEGVSLGARVDDGNGVLVTVDVGVFEGV